VRTCGEVLRYVAFWNRYVAAALRVETAGEAGNELPAAKYLAKARILEALRQTAQDAAAALREAQVPAAEIVLPFVEHTSEHYGQLAVYARLLDLAPPSSQA